MTLLGGLGTFLGPVLGSSIVIALQDTLADRAGSWVTVIIGGDLRCLCPVVSSWNRWRVRCLSPAPSQVSIVGRA